MNRLSRFYAPAALALMLAVAGCSDGPISGPSDTTPMPGSLVVVLNGQDAGGVLVTVRGPGISQPRVLADGQDLFVRASDDDGYRVALLGDRLTGNLFAFDVPDVGRADLYEVSLLQVAGLDNNLLESLDAYSVSVQRAEEVSP